MTSENHSSGKNNGQNRDQFAPAVYLADMEKFVKALTLSAMAAGNDKDFTTAFSEMELALWLSQSLEMTCLEAVLLNNLGLLHTLKGSWDRALLFFDRSMALAIDSCPSHDTFLAILKKNIACLFDPKIATPGDSPH